HGTITDRAHEICRLVSFADSAKVTDNLWGERWSKLVANTMANGVSACTGLPGSQIAQNETIRHFQAARQRGDPHRPSPRLHARRDRSAAARDDSPRRRGRSCGTQDL